MHSATGAVEAMRYLKAGRYKLHVVAQGAAVVKRITVRAIPALHQAFYGSVPHIQAWKESGRSWIAIQGYGVADVKFDAHDSADKVFAAWSASQGYQHPLMNGIIVDEFGGGDGIEYDVYRRVVERLNATYKPKIYMPYGGRFYGDDRSTKFAQAALHGGGYVCPEYYLTEQPSRPQAEQFIDELLRPPPRQVRRAIQLLDELPLAGVQSEGDRGQTDGHRLARRPEPRRTSRPGADGQLR
ncbi:MAG: hypothetical protein GXY83_17630 [Rhodopirellula sp.]|nr:hypothetical protein [Rhodopirellula sp.]